MNIIRITLWATLAVLVDVSLARAAFGAIVPSLRAGLGLDFAAAGLVSGSNAIGYLITSAAAPVLGERLGLRRTAIFGHLVAALGFAASALAPSVTLLVAARLLSGLGGGAGMVAALRIALDAARPDQRLSVSTFAWAGAGLGLVLAAIAVPWLNDPFTWRIAMWFSAALALAVAAFAPRAVVATPPAQTLAAAEERYRWQSSSLILAAYLLFGLGFLAYSTFAVVGPTHASPFFRFLAIGCTAIVGSVLISRIRHPERAMGVMLLLGALGAAFAVAALPIGDIFFGIGLTAVPGLATAVLRARAGTAAATRAIALSTIVVGSGQFLGPLIAGAAAQRFGIAWAFGVAGAAYAIAVLLVGLDEIQRAHPVSEERRRLAGVLD